MINPDQSSEGPRRPPPFDPNNRKKVQFSQDELRVLKECNKESFYQRCLPLSALLAGSSYYAVKAGFLKGNPKFGATPKVIVSVIVGYFVGKFSYQSKCAEKLMQLPNSQIGEMLRQKRRGNIRENMDNTFGPGLSLAPFSGINTSDTYSDVSPYSSLDIDTNRPENKGLDDYNRPSMDNSNIENLEEMPPEQKYATTYEELRKKNREEYTQKRIGKSPESKPPATTNFSNSSSNSTEKIESKNKYGDNNFE
ncbi:unnamed protein product [Psylliodes chrysocephalus]|uniref:OCIA domain-containing protein n=1 Tax=Psylliodes chrysocephalus TaxID=3402493 RepID=A0A9P0CQV3_9CUCU|nr:unnamed protein product [Psylliodes chrysocephala]